MTFPAWPVSGSQHTGAGRRPALGPGWPSSSQPPTPRLQSVLRPLARAYVLGYVSTVTPRLLTVLLTIVTARRRQRRRLPLAQPEKASLTIMWDTLKRTVRGGFEWRRFPTFCAALVGGTKLMEVLFWRWLTSWASGLSVLVRLRLSRFLSSFMAAAISIRLLQSKPSNASGGTNVVIARAAGASGAAGSEGDADAAQRQVVAAQSGPAILEQAVSPTLAVAPTGRCAGRTLDLTLFAVTRACDVLAGELWAQRKKRRQASGSWTRLESLVGYLTDPAIFSISSAMVMWTWIYQPSRLPRTYDKWINSAAAVDGRLTEVLRRCRRGVIRYGDDTGPDSLILQSMCDDYGWPRIWADPAVTAPFPCEMVHMGCGPSCEYHALVRMWRSWRWSMTTYLPLSLLLVLRQKRRSSRALASAVLSAVRSSAFLGAFITLFFYGVCLARNRVGPRLLGTSLSARQALDGGLCTAAGCALCGWSILIERSSRRKDIGLFVAPRALATLLPRRYALNLEWRETFVFAASTAVVFTAIQENPARVRGVLGSLLAAVFAL